MRLTLRPFLPLLAAAIPLACGARVALEVGPTATAGAGGVSTTTVTGMGGAGTTSSTSTTWTTSSTSTSSGTTSSSTTASSSSSSSSSGSNGVAVTGTLVELTPAIGVYSIALDADYVYATVPNGGKVVKVPKQGGPLTVLAALQGTPSYMVMDDQRIYYMGPLNQLRSMSKTGTGLKTHASWANDLCVLAVDATRIYCALVNQQQVLAIDKNTDQQTVLADAGTVRSLCDDGDTLFWGPDGTGAIGSISKAGGPSIELAPAFGPVWSIVADSTRVYWGQPHGMAGVVSTPESGGEAQLLAASSTGDIVRVAVDDINVYWTRALAGTLSMVPKDGGGEVKVLAKGLDYPVAIAVDASGVYFGVAYGPLLRWTP